MPLLFQRCVYTAQYVFRYNQIIAPINSKHMMGVGYPGFVWRMHTEYDSSRVSVPRCITNLIKTPRYYTKMFGKLALLSIGLTVVFTLLLPLMKRLVQNVA